MPVDITDVTFETEVLQRSMTVTVVVNMWSPRSEPSKAMGSRLEAAIAGTNGRVCLANVNVDEFPSIAQAFKVQSIPTVVALREGAPINGFAGVQPDDVIRQFVSELLPSVRDEEISALLSRGDEKSLSAVLDIDPGNEKAVVALANIFTARNEGDAALALLARVPETEVVRKAAASARLSLQPLDDFDVQLEKLLNVVKNDVDARQQFLDILEVMGPDDWRTSRWRKKLTARLF